MKLLFKPIRLLLATISVMIATISVMIVFPVSDFSLNYLALQFITLVLSTYFIMFLIDIFLLAKIKVDLLLVEQQNLFYELLEIEQWDFNVKNGHIGFIGKDKEELGMIDLKTFHEFIEKEAFPKITDENYEQRQKEIREKFRNLLQKGN